MTEQNSVNAEYLAAREPESSQIDQQREYEKRMFLQTVYLTAGRYGIDPADININWDNGVIDVHAENDDNKAAVYNFCIELDSIVNNIK